VEALVQRHAGEGPSSNAAAEHGVDLLQAGPRLGQHLGGDAALCCEAGDSPRLFRAVRSHGHIALGEVRTA
jgi:hypothetical protein